MPEPLLRVPLDRTSPVPLYFQVAQQLEHAIEAGELPPGTRPGHELPPGTRLDNEIQLADDYGLSRPTMRRAIQYLVERGLLVRRRGVGTQVVHARVKRQVELSSLYDDLTAAGQRPTTQVLVNAVVPADGTVAPALGLPAGSAVMFLERLRLATGEPLARMRNRS